MPPVLALLLQIVGALQNGDVRLIDGLTATCGRVEIFYDGDWGRVCNESWTETSANVVCRQLGYGYALKSSIRNDSSPADYESSPVHDLECPPYATKISDCNQTLSWEVHNCTQEKNISDCNQTLWEGHNCTQEDYVWVCCDPKPPSLPVRLTCPDCSDGSPCKVRPNRPHPARGQCRPRPAVAGIVEVLVDGVWGPVSADGWDANEATVICGQLGYPMSFPLDANPPILETIWPRYSEIVSLSEELGLEEAVRSIDSCHVNNSEQLQLLIQSFSTSLLQGLECSGNESQLLNCSMTGVGVQPNPTRRVAAVKCGFRPHHKCLPQTIRVRAGAVPWAGRVEVLKNDKWGTICDDGFGETESNVICRHLGYGTVKTISGYGRGVEKTHYTKLRCTGYEDRIESCDKVSGTVAKKCGHERDVGIHCNVPDALLGSNDEHLIVTIKEYGGDLYPQIRGASGWGIFCHSSTAPVITREVGEVICRQTYQQFLLSTASTALTTDHDGVYYDGSIRCSGTKYSLSKCDVNIMPLSSCSEGYTTIQCTTALADLVPDVSILKKSLKSDFPLPIQVHTMSILQCAYDEGCLARSATQNGVSRRLLRFSSMTWNWGLGSFVPLVPSEDWEWHTCHYHYHSMEEFAHYDLLRSDTEYRVAEGHKASFCLADSECASGYSRQYNCYDGNQGISHNCGDLYANHLDCQWIDITGVSYGEYELRVSINPNQLGLESDYSNNNASCRIEIASDYDSYLGWIDVVRVQDCWLSDH